MSHFLSFAAETHETVNDSCKDASFDTVVKLKQYIMINESLKIESHCHHCHAKAAAFYLFNFGMPTTMPNSKVDKKEFVFEFVRVNRNSNIL